MIRHWGLALMLAAGLLRPAAAQEATARFGPEGGTEILVRSTTDIEVLGPAIDAFVEASPGLAVVYEQWGSNALFAASRTECAESGAVPDVVFSSAVHQMVELVNSACAAPYRSPLTAALPPDRIWRDELWGVTLEAAVIIYNTALVPEADVPHTRFELLDLMRREDARYQGKIATYDIEASGLGYLFAFADSLEASTFGSLIEGFARAGAVATCCSAEIIGGVSSGDYLIAYNVLGSYADPARFANVGIVLPTDYTLFLSRAYMIPKAAAHKAEAGALLDFLLSEEGQAILAGQGLVMARGGDDGALPDSAHRTIRIEPMLLVARDQQRRARFIERWRDGFGQATLNEEAN